MSEADSGREAGARPIHEDVPIPPLPEAVEVVLGGGGGPRGEDDELPNLVVVVALLPLELMLCELANDGMFCFLLLVLLLLLFCT